MKRGNSQPSLAQAEKEIEGWAKFYELSLAPDKITLLAREALAQNPRSESELSDEAEDLVLAELPEEDDGEEEEDDLVQED